MKTFNSLATIPKSGIKSMADGGIRVFVDTQELTADQMATLFQFKGELVKFVLASEGTKITEQDLEIPDEILEYKGEKSKSQRLRNIIYKIWELKTSQKQPFEEFYRIKMETIIEQIKNKLE